MNFYGKGFKLMTSMPINKSFLRQVVFFVVLVITASCGEELLPEVSVDNIQTQALTYKMTILAGKEDNESASTRALDIDNNGKLASSWVEGESISVYNETQQTSFDGLLIAQSSGKNTTLMGLLTGYVSEGDQLTLKYLSPQYNSQDGTLTGNETSIDKVCDYATATISVASINNGVISAAGSAHFINQQAICKFKLRNDNNTSNVYVKFLTVTVGDNVINVTPSVASNELYVAIPAFDSNTITLQGGDDHSVFYYEKSGVTFESGKYYSITVRMSTQSVMDYIMEKIIRWNTYSVDDDVVIDYMSEMQDDGSWNDINYQDEYYTWEPQNHYQRIIPMACAYVNPESSLYKSDELYDKIVLGIEYWLYLNIRSPWWYQNQINEPESFGMILICMRKGNKHLSSEIEENIIERWRNNDSDPEALTGANRTETALHWMYFACLLNDNNLLQTALNYLYEPVRYVEDEGFQVDGCFFQHGHQLYIGGYGEVLLESVLQTAVCTKGTQYALPEEKMKIIRNYVINAWSNVIRGEVMHWNAIGRQLTRPDFLRFPERRVPIISKMIEADPANSVAYNQIRNRLLGLSAPNDAITPRHIHFYRGDYTLHVEHDYTFSVRMASTRTGKQEMSTGENLKGYYLSYGATVLTKTGREYLDLMPLWDWTRIPGVTIPKDCLYTSWWEGNGPTNFAGGVSKTVYGCTGYQYYDDTHDVNTGASKGYFFFGDEIVCLGAGINSSHPVVQTTINQCWGQGDVTIGKETGNTTLNGSVNETRGVDYRWILHDGIGYFFPDNQKVFFENAEKTGNWKWISNLQADKEITGKVFTLGIEHSSPVQDDKYSYIIIPNSTVSSLTSRFENNNIEVLTNTESAQIVYHKQKKIYECVFYRACTYQGDIEISSQQPCVMIIQKQNNEYAVSIADPTQSGINMVIGIKDSDMNSMSYGSCSFIGIEKQYAGMTKEFTISR